MGRATIGRAVPKNCGSKKSWLLRRRLLSLQIAPGERTVREEDLDGRDEALKRLRGLLGVS